MISLSRCSLLLFGLLVLLGTPRSHAQSSEAQLQGGIEAYREERFADALAAFESVTTSDPDNAEAHYLLARVLFDTPLRDERRAGRAIERARELDPDNLQYMVAELQQLRTDTWNFFQELQRTRKRLDLAQDILERDPQNSFAHEELGIYYIRDFWYYRNAIAFPSLSFASRGLGLSDDQSANEAEQAIDFGEDNPDDNSGGLPGQEVGSFNSFDTITDAADFGTPGALPISDRFDVGTLQAQSESVLELESRANRVYEQAVYHLNAALENDPRRRAVYDHLMRVHSMAENWDAARSMLTQMLVYFPEDEVMWRYLGLANHRAGDGDAADTSFREAFERMDETQRMVFEDISLLIPEDELTAYRENPEVVTDRFWTSKEPRFLTPYNERRLEHYSRLTFADLMYKSEDLNKPGWDTQRGRIHVRYGVPKSDVIIVGGYQGVLESMGTRADGFKPSLGESQAMDNNRFNIWDYGDFKFVFEDPIANGEFRLYSPPADLFATVGGGAVERNDYEIIANNTFKETPEAYDYQPPGRRIGLPYLVTSFRGNEGQTDLYVHYGIPLSERAEDTEADLVDLTVKTGAFLISDDRDILAERRRTLYGLRTAQIETFEETQLWTDTQPMNAPPGTHEVSVEFETVGGGTSAVQRRSIDVPDYSGSELALSSIMLAYAVEDTEAERLPGLIVRDGLAIKPAPWSVFNHEQPIYLFFEIYNLAMTDGRSDYEVDAQLRTKDTSTGIARLARNIFGGGDTGVSSQYEVQREGPDDTQSVSLDASNLEPGFYTITVQIRDRVSGRTVDQTTDLYLE